MQKVSEIILAEKEAANNSPSPSLCVPIVLLRAFQVPAAVLLQALKVQAYVVSGTVCCNGHYVEYLWSALKSMRLQCASVVNVLEVAPSA